jgi:hypothetical protein
MDLRAITKLVDAFCWMSCRILDLGAEYRAWCAIRHFCLGVLDEIGAPAPSTPSSVIDAGSSVRNALAAAKTAAKEGIQARRASVNDGHHIAVKVPTVEHQHVESGGIQE